MLQLPALLTHLNAPELLQELRSHAERNTTLTLDLSQVERIDSAGAAALATFVRHCGEINCTLHISAISENARGALKLFPFRNSVAFQDTPPEPFFVRLGGVAAYAATMVEAYASLLVDVLWFAVAGLWRRGTVSGSRIVFEMSRVGSQALGVVGLISFLVGCTMALQSAYQLRQFGANIFVADLIGVSITRELGPLMAAIVVAGRSGSAIAAELATMTITEEIDALRTMGISPLRFLVVPKTLAMTITQPLLTMMANALAIFGAFLVAITYLDVGADPFVTRLQQALFVKDILTGLFKSILFANLIVTLGAFCGLRARGGADAVGRATTASVVVGIFAVIVADALCSLLFYFGD